MPTLKNWSREFNWQERIVQRSIEINKRLEQKTNEAIISKKSYYSKIVKEAIDKWYEKFAEGKAGPDNVADLERLLKMDLLLMGESPENTDHKTINIIVKEA
jgi:hypothetical protein